jgi:hypothetical protein
LWSVGKVTTFSLRTSDESPSIHKIEEEGGFCGVLAKYQLSHLELVMNRPPSKIEEEERFCGILEKY